MLIVKALFNIKGSLLFTEDISAELMRKTSWIVEYKNHYQHFIEIFIQIPFLMGKYVNI